MIPDRIRLLSTLIACKPISFSSEWASSIDQAFGLYTRTSTVNLINSWNQCLIENDWPFPGYLDLREEIDKSHKDVVSLLRRRWLIIPSLLWRGPSLSLMVLAAGFAEGKDALKGKQICDALMVTIFERHLAGIFLALGSAKVLQPKQPMLQDIEQAYRRKMWVACINTAFPLLDFVMRSFFGTDKLKVTIQVLRDAYIREAKLQPKDLMPGSAIWLGQLEPDKGNTFAKSIDEDLRLPGIYLSSFFEFADRYYQWYTSTAEPPRSTLNRHAVMHCSSEYWTRPNAVKILTFLDLTVRLESVIKLLVHGEAALMR